MAEEENEKIAMVVGAHPDDPDIGAGGTVGRMIKAGWRIVYVVCTNGDKGTSDPDMTSERLAEIREKEQRAAAAAIGVSEIVFLGYPDGDLEDTKVFRGQLVRLLRKYRPHTVFTHDPYRKYMTHRDHRVAGQVALDAVFPYSRDQLFYPEHRQEGLTPHKVTEVYLFGSEDPNHFVDISETWDSKNQAVGCHITQFGDHSADWEKWCQERKERTVAMMGRPGIPLCESFRKIEIRR
jgi:LmbE family N-acetylglucosaminyl deacetylase